MSARLKLTIALLMGATIFRAQTVLFLPEVAMFGGPAPDAWFAPWLSDAILGFMLPAMLWLFWNRRADPLLGRQPRRRRPCVDPRCLGQARPPAAWRHNRRGRATKRDAAGAFRRRPRRRLRRGPAGRLARPWRPARFDVISGVSTGAIIALLTLLGPEEEQALERFYTGYRTADLFTPAPLAAIGGGSSLLDASRFNAIVDEFIDDDVVDRIEAQFRVGRILLIGATNLDAARPVIWNVTAVAASGHPRARDLIRDVVKASAAIPAVIPPVVIPVTLPGGATRDEVRVDGGATQQVMVFSPEIPIAEVDAAVGGRIDRTIYVIVNNALGKVHQPVGLDVLSIADGAVSSLIGGSGAGDLYKIYALASREAIDFNVTWIPQSFYLTPLELFDPVYMRAVYDLGYEIGLAGGGWRSHPPFFSP